jgi:hypothetical protein
LIAGTRLAEAFYIAWRNGEDAQALTWWADRMQRNSPLVRLPKKPQTVVPILDPAGMAALRNE